VGKLIDDFFLPYLAIRNRKAGYAVSIVKAGAKIVGHDAGPVRTPDRLHAGRARRAGCVDQEAGPAIKRV
jgi:hypothetical protein